MHGQANIVDEFQNSRYYRIKMDTNFPALSDPEDLSKFGMAIFIILCEPYYN